MDTYSHAREVFNRASHPDALREMQIAPAEEWQVEDAEPAPRISVRFALGLALLAAGIAVHHAVWSANL